MNIKKLIDENPLGPLQFLVFFQCFVLNMLDGMDVQAIAYSAPEISKEWAINPQTLGIVFSAALVGMTIGAMFISPFTDRIGRRKMILLSLIMIGVGMIGSSFAQTIDHLVVLRLLTGLGIGSILASSTSMVAEFAPGRVRNVSITIYHSGYPIGAIVTGLVATWLIPAHGWRPLFMLAGVISLAMLPLVYLYLPESVEFLLTRRPPRTLERINEILRRMGHPVMEELPPQEAKQHSVVGGVGALLQDGRAVSTLLLWLAFFMSFAALYFLFSWVVKLANDSGLPIDDAMYAGIAMNMGAFCGSISLGYYSGSTGLKKIIFLYFIGAVCMIIPYGFVKGSVPTILTMIFVLMLFVQGAFAGLYVVAARLYPTEIRTTGVGWAIGAGRFGAVFGPAAAGFMLGAGLSISWTFAVFAIPLALAGLTIINLHSAEID